MTNKTPALPQEVKTEYLKGYIQLETIKNNIDKEYYILKSFTDEWIVFEDRQEVDNYIDGKKYYSIFEPDTAEQLEDFILTLND